MSHEKAAEFVIENLSVLCREVVELKQGARVGPYLIHLQQLVPRVGSSLLLACSYVADGAMEEIVRLSDNPR